MLTNKNFSTFYNRCAISIYTNGEKEWWDKGRRGQEIVVLDNIWQKAPVGAGSGGFGGLIGSTDHDRG